MIPSFRTILKEKADHSFEIEEIKRTIDDLKLDIKPEELLNKFDNAHAIKLTTNVWSKLENTDYDVKTKKDVKVKLKEYGRDENNYEKILDEFSNSHCYEPLIINFDNRYYLVAGNTRLMVAKVNNITPFAKVVEL